jgi:hypothetical protein
VKDSILSANHMLHTSMVHNIGVPANICLRGPGLAGIQLLSIGRMRWTIENSRVTRDEAILAQSQYHRGRPYLPHRE